MMKKNTDSLQFILFFFGDALFASTVFHIVVNLIASFLHRVWHGIKNGHSIFESS